MHTWSVEEAIIRAQSAVAVAVQGVWDKLVAVERVTRPPRLGHDYDAVSPDGYYGYADPNLDGAEWLAGLEAAIDSWEPDELLSPYGRSLTADERELAPAPWKVLIDGAHGCSITLEDNHGGDGVWLHSSTAVEINRAIFLREEAVRELRDALFIRCAMVAAGISNPSEYDDDPMVSDSYLSYNEVESGHDMGARLAAEMFPQYANSSTGHQCSGSVEHPAGVDTSFPPEVPPAGPNLRSLVEDHALIGYRGICSPGPRCNCGVHVASIGQWADHFTAALPNHKPQ